MSEQQSISIVIPTFNRAPLLGRAIDSALAAVARGDEIIVVDDGSTDGTRTLLEGYGDRIRPIFAAHAGAGAARNRGLREARRPLVAFLDSDDAWMPDRLTVARALMVRRPDLVCTFSDFMVISRGMESHKYLWNWHKDSRSWDEILKPGSPYSTFAALPEGRPDFQVHIGWLYRSLMHANYMATFTVTVRRALVGGNLYFPEDVPLYEDWECFARLARCGPVAFLDCETAINYGHPGPRLTDADDCISADTCLTMLQRVWGSDPEFLREHEAEFRTVLAKVRLGKARWLITSGRMDEARQELRQVSDRPFSYQLLASMPGGLVTRLLAIRRRLSSGHGNEQRHVSGTGAGDQDDSLHGAAAS